MPDICKLVCYLSKSRQVACLSVCIDDAVEVARSGSDADFSGVKGPLGIARTPGIVVLFGHISLGYIRA